MINPKKVIIDCGHGGIIDGRYTTAPHKMYQFDSDNLTAYEGVINRAIGSKLEFLLQKESIPFFSLNTHDQSDMPLGDRYRKINNLYAGDKSYWTLSIHSNTASNEHRGKGSKATGFEVWTSVGETVSDKIAEVAAKHYRESFPNYRFRSDNTDGDSDKESNFAMVYRTNCPAILVENLFYDNRKEAEYLISESGQLAIAGCLIKIIKEVRHANLW